MKQGWNFSRSKLKLSIQTVIAINETEKIVFVNGTMTKYAKQLVAIEMNGLTLPEKTVLL